MNHLLYKLGYRYYVVDYSSSNMCLVVGIDWNKKDHNSLYRAHVWEKALLKSVWNQ